MDSTGTDAWPLACPVCGAALRHEGGALACAAGHSFDVAREGYVNLLTDAHRSRGMVGDTVPMLRARRAFLEAGYYAPLRDTLVGEVVRLLEARGTSGGTSRPTCVAEVGCGEGYYIGAVAAGLKEAQRPHVVFVGADLSKAAVRLAARRYADVTCVVADTHRRLYLADGSVGVLLDVFAPRNPDEFARVLEPGGHALVAIPAPDHLEPLRTRLGLIGLQEDKERQLIDQFSARFSLAGRLEVAFPLTLSAEAVRDLIDMGPSHWHVESDRVVEEGTARAQASFIVLDFERRSSAS